MLPKDPFILFSVINTRLRDSGMSLESLCKSEDTDIEEIKTKLLGISMFYDEDNNCFKKK